MIISGGGTGGHIFPALAIANAFKFRHPDADILFVGAEGRMEMTRVPEAGYKIIGLWISGIQRKLTLSNILFPVKLLSSYLRAGKIVREFRPHAVVGTGGYASGPIMLAANRMKVPTLIQEQNSFAGITNKLAAKKATRVCVAYDGMEKYFPKDKIVFTGNPVRKDILDLSSKREMALRKFGFESNKKTILVIGGSLGARTINESMFGGIEKLIDASVQLIWQTGKYYFEEYKAKLSGHDLRKIRIQAFVKEMDLAYAAADLVISRAGALSVSELCVASKASILVPSPNVAEDHQTKNAMAMVERDAAVMVRDREAYNNLINEALALLFDGNKLERLSKNAAAMAKPNATEDIVNELEKMIGTAGEAQSSKSQVPALVIG